MKKRTITITLLFCFAINLFMPAAAKETLPDSSEGTEYSVDELIILASRAAREGDIDTANQYEAQIESLGVETLSTQEAYAWISAETELTEGPALLSTVNPPPDTSAVHWYRSEYSYSYINGKIYDIVKIQAVSWDDTNDWLHVEGQINLSTMESFSLDPDEILGAVGFISTPFDLFFTLGDVFEGIGQLTSEYSQIQIMTSNSLGDTTHCMYTVDMTVGFWWIKEHNTSDPYVLRLQDQVLDIAYSYMFIARLVRNDGEVESIPANSPSLSDIYYPLGYNDSDNVCSAYLADQITQQYVPGIIVRLGEHTSTITPFNIPPYMESLA